MRFALVISICLITACTNIKERRGAEIRDVKVAQIMPESSKGDVANLLGSPSTTSSFGEEVWYYINNKKRRVLFGDDEIMKQQVLAITFDTNGKVVNVEGFDKDDSKNIAFSNDVTPTSGHKLGVLEQILGNVGKFNTDSMGRGSGTRGGN